MYKSRRSFLATASMAAAGSALGFRPFKNGVGIADRVGESFVGEIVEFGCGIGVRSLSHRFAPVAWVRPRRVLQHLARPTIILY